MGTDTIAWTTLLGATGRGCYGLACWDSLIVRQQREKTAWEAIADTTEAGTVYATTGIPINSIIPNPDKIALMIEKPFGSCE